MPPSWRDEFSQSLRDRDEREKASYSIIDDDIINAYSELLARTTALEAEKEAALEAAASVTPKQIEVKSPKPGTPKSPARSATPTDVPATAQLKSDLAEALRSNSSLQSRLKNAEAEVQRLRTKTMQDAKTLDKLNRERTQLSQKTKDRDEELKGKAKFLDDAQDEIISLNLQLNMSEQKNKKLETDNNDLVARWMEYKAVEADRWNKTLQE
ncbi:hypothetical protein GLAREA_11313 [Glarea lozoyensis ATCC 20868]|uniref:Autophagy-related protein 16 domain-containing protein n=1 Tax=Glarea lozoyensis (strain ATCC 20868 / MF5171) TaxID=1116229 RepID=S3EBC2_GLAL2|nr:uncharacterized protein GLAREA_11313 [Glarea lozoyensis ATCC 20868]EPE35613.1 hypothetical protein GLAREA_11313 [Glarea lozoyensis ATCC 20868]